MEEPVAVKDRVERLVLWVDCQALRVGLNCCCRISCLECGIAFLFLVFKSTNLLDLARVFAIVRIGTKSLLKMLNCIGELSLQELRIRVSIERALGMGNEAQDAYLKV